MRLRTAVFAVLLGSLWGCSHPQQLPVSVSRCDAVANASGFSVDALVRNDGEKPISSIDMAVDFYQSFRYQRFSTAVHLKTELDPGKSRRLHFGVLDSGTAREQGGALRCLVTRIGYLDGTSLTLPPAQ